MLWKFSLLDSDMQLLRPVAHQYPKYSVCVPDAHGAYSPPRQVLKHRKAIEDGAVRLTLEQFCRLIFLLKEPPGLTLLSARPDKSSWMSPLVYDGLFIFLRNF